MPTGGLPRVQIRVTQEVEMALAELASAGVPPTDAVTALAHAWREYNAAAGGSGGTIRVTCTEDRDTEALRQLLRTDDATVVLGVGRVRGGPDGGTVNGLPATPPAPAEAPASAAAAHAAD